MVVVRAQQILVRPSASTVLFVREQGRLRCPADWAFYPGTGLCYSALSNATTWSRRKVVDACKTTFGGRIARPVNQDALEFFLRKSELL